MEIFCGIFHTTPEDNLPDAHLLQCWHMVRIGALSFAFFDAHIQILISRACAIKNYIEQQR